VVCEVQQAKAPTNAAVNMRPNMFAPMKKLIG
jgi:hypothetical protein